MSARAVTPWFDPGAKPVRAGVYELSDVPYPFHYWCGKGWLRMAETRPSNFKAKEIRAEVISGDRLESGYVTTVKWRGLASNPKRGAA